MSEFSKLNGYDVKDKKAIRYYLNVNDMKSDSTLKEGMLVETKGYYNSNDGGSSKYSIVNDSNLSEDNGSIHEIINGLFAILINDGTVNVKQFGAYGDGIHDDTLSIQKAIDTFDNIVIDKGTYIFTNIILKENKKLSGNGTLKVKDNLCVDNTQTYYLIIMQSNSIIEGLTIDGNKENNTSYRVADLITTMGDNLIIRNNKLINVIDSGIMFSETINSVCEGNIIKDSTDCGIYCNNNNTDKKMNSVIRNNIIKNAGSSGISMKRGCRYLNIEYNILTDCTNGITSENANTNIDFSKEFNIIGNTIMATAIKTTGIDTRGGYLGNIKDNRIYNYKFGITVQGSHDLNILNNIIELYSSEELTSHSVGIALTGRTGTAFNYIYNINVENNILNMNYYNISTYYQRCIHVYSSDNTSGINIIGNKINGNTYATGISSSAQVNDMVIKNNVINVGDKAILTQGINLYADNTIISGTYQPSFNNYFAKDQQHRYFTANSNVAPTPSSNYINGDIVFNRYGSLGTVFAYQYDGTQFKTVSFDN